MLEAFPTVTFERTVLESDWLQKLSCYWPSDVLTLDISGSAGKTRDLKLELDQWWV